MRMRLSALALSAALTLTGCSSLVGGPPTPEPFAPPPSPTPRVAATATATPAPDVAQPTAAPAGASIIVERGDVVRNALYEGEVIAPQRRPLSFTQSGLVSAVQIGGPGKVTKGQLLAELATDDLQPQLEAAQAEYDRTQDALKRAQDALELPVRKATIALRAAEDELAQARQPASPEELAAARSNLRKAEATLAKVRNDASATKTSAELTFKQAEKALRDAQAEYGAAAQASQADPKDSGKAARLVAATSALRAAEQAYSEAKIAYDTAAGNEVALVASAEADVDEARVRLSELEKMPDPYVVKAAQRAVELAQIELAEARSRAALDPEVQARADQAEKALDEIKAQIDARRLYAPADGEVTEVLIKEGAALQAGDTVMILSDPAVSADMREVWVAQVADVSELRAGQEVIISIAGAPQSVEARLTQILTDSASGLSTLQITFPSGGFSAAAGERAGVEIILKRRTGVLWLPPGAIQNDGEPFVTVEVDGGPQRVAVVLGVESRDRIEITSGVSEGQTIMLP